MIFNNEIFILVVIFLSLCLIAVSFILNPLKRSDYKSTVYLTTKAEQNFYNQLKRVMPSYCEINCKVRLVDICQPRDNRNRSLFNKVVGKHIDFVITQRKNNKILCCIELDDRSHNTFSAKERDNVKNVALKQAGIPLYRIKNTKSYNKSQLSRILSSFELDSSDSPKKKQETEVGNKDQLYPIKPLGSCPKCGSRKIHKVQMKLFNKGNHFYECQSCEYRSEVTNSK